MPEDSRSPPKQTYLHRQTSLTANPQRTIYSLMEQRQNKLPEIRLHTGSVQQRIHLYDHEPLPHYLNVDEGDCKHRTKKSMKAQRSCESYDSATSGMSWSSSQSASTNQNRNDESSHILSSYPSFSDYHDDGGRIKHLTPVIGHSCRNNRSVREQKSKKVFLRAGDSFDEVKEKMDNQGKKEIKKSGSQSLEMHKKLHEYSQDKTKKEETSLVPETPPKSFGKFWKRALKLVRSTKEPELKEPQGELDPVYELLKFAAVGATKSTSTAATTNLKIKDCPVRLSETRSDSTLSLSGDSLA